MPGNQALSLTSALTTVGCGENEHLEIQAARDGGSLWLDHLGCFILSNWNSERSNDPSCARLGSGQWLHHCSTLLLNFTDSSCENKAVLVACLLQGNRQPWTSTPVAKKFSRSNRKQKSCRIDSQPLEGALSSGWEAPVWSTPIPSWGLLQTKDRFSWGLLPAAQCFLYAEQWEKPRISVQTQSFQLLFQSDEMCALMLLP